ncbi:MAG: S1C family serine protease, partial [Pseudomonadales bacterium]
MKKFWFVFLIGFIAGAGLLSFLKEEATAATDPMTVVAPQLTSDEANNIAVFEAASPSVVFVTNTQLRRQRFSLNVLEIPKGSGTGFIWDNSGLIVTNFHVVYGANKINIALQSGQQFEAKVVGTSPEKDIALLKIDAPKEMLTPLPLGNSDALAVGRKVLAIGNPFALGTSPEKDIALLKIDAPK